MFFLLYGPDTYRSRKKLREIIEEHRKKTGSLNFFRFDAQEDKAGDIEGALGGGSLFAVKKLVVIENAFSSAVCDIISEKLKSFADSESAIAVFWEGEAGGEAVRKRISDFLKSGSCRAQEFKLLSGGNLERWLETELKNRGLRIGREEKISLLSAFGSDLWALSGELDKISLSGKTAARPRHSETVFSLGDSFFSDRRRALNAVFQLFKNGESDFGIFSYLLNYLRTIIAVKECGEKNVPLPPFFKIHPFVAKKALLAGKSVPMAKFVFLLRRFFGEDLKIKTGLARPKDSLFSLLFAEKKN